MLTPVILVCVHDLEDIHVINHNMLYSLFSNYGNVLRILIFERTNTFKAFVEYDNLQSANDAKKNLNRAFLFEGKYRISIYPSNLKVIKFQNNFPGGVDYTLARIPENGESLQNMAQFSPYGAYNGNKFSLGASPNSHREGGSSKSSSEVHSSSYSGSLVEEDQSNDDELLQMINRHHDEKDLEDCSPEEGPNENEEKDDTDDFNSMVQNAFCNSNVYEIYGNPNYPVGLDDASSFPYLRRNRRLPTFPMPQSKISNSFEYPSFRNPQRMSTFSEYSRPYSSEEIQTCFDPTEACAGFNGNFDSAYQPHDQMESYHPSFRKGKGSPKVSHENTSESGENKENEERESPVLHVLGIENKEVTTRMLFNIFSNFGNILKLMFIKTRAVALVEFQKIAHATSAKTALNNISFMGKPLRITYSKYQTIQLHSGQDEKYPEQLIIGDERNFSFKEGKNIVEILPSQVLQVSNLAVESNKDKKMLSNLFGTYGEVKAVKSSSGDNGKNMCLIKMKTMEDCLKAMAQLHDTEVNGRKIQISFSRSKI